MKRINNTFIVAFLSAGAFLSACDKDDYTGYSNLDPSNPTVTIELPTEEINFVEKDSTFTFKVTLSEPQIVDVAVYISAVGGEAVLDDDFTIDNTTSRVLIPANTTQAEATITVIGDHLIEDTETFQIKIGDERTTNAQITPVTINFTIHDSPPALTASADWNGSFTFNGEEYDFADYIDLDFHLIDSEGEEVTGYAAATGSNPEVMDIVSDLPDGTYTLYLHPYATTDFSSTVFDGEALEFDIPITFSFTRGDGDHFDFVYDSLTSSSTDIFSHVDGNDNGVSEFIPVFEITKTGLEFEVVAININGSEQVGTLRKAIPDIKRKKK